MRPIGFKFIYNKNRLINIYKSLFPGWVLLVIKVLGKPL